MKTETAQLALILIFLLGLFVYVTMFSGLEEGLDIFLLLGGLEIAICLIVVIVGNKSKTKSSPNHNQLTKKNEKQDNLKIHAIIFRDAKK